MSDEMVTVKKSDLEFVRAYNTALEGMKVLLTRERDEARAERDEARAERDAARARIDELSRELTGARYDADSTRAELARLLQARQAPPVPDHVHEVGSCSVCEAPSAMPPRDLLTIDEIVECICAPTGGLSPAECLAQEIRARLASVTIPIKPTKPVS